MVCISNLIVFLIMWKLLSISTETLEQTNNGIKYNKTYQDPESEIRNP